MSDEWKTVTDYSPEFEPWHWYNHHRIENHIFSIGLACQYCPQGSAQIIKLRKLAFMLKSRKKKRQAILKKQKNVKLTPFDFERISLFFLNKGHENEHQLIDERTLSDLDFEELFIAMDRTSSSVGQQVLYSRLRVIPSNPSLSLRYDQYIDYLSAEQKEDAILALSGLNSQGAYFLQRLFLGKQLAKPKWFWLIPSLSLALILTLLLSTFFHPLLMVAILLMCINSLFHLWNKNNILGYSNSIPQLLNLQKTATVLNENGLFLNPKENVTLAIQKLKKIRRASLFFKWESESLDEITQVFGFVFDLIKAVFLIEPIVLFKLLGQIESNKDDIKTLFEAVGELDMAISLDTWRNSLPYYCLPAIHASIEKTWDAQNMYHPLIEHPVANDLSALNRKSILLTGSNMSGKTTFIRTIGLNALLAQTVNTACATELTLSPFNVYSAIRIADDLLENTSYYYEEVKTIKRFTEESKQEQFNLFLLDEIFKGTNTIERIASGKAVLSHLNDEGNLVFCSTHDLELIDYLHDEYDYYHFEEAISGEELTFDYKLKKGSLNRSNAIRILEINNFPDAITAEAHSLANELLKSKGL